ncbi:PLDc N-terminal domain-containing protein [Haloarchaeobius baliensis]|uniref:PLDc N-terminal domain-containing protein n=1 Tax=Haloarchaeobius baliensis TaxID=1670458 RepID=UPI003F884095
MAAEAIAVLLALAVGLAILVLPLVWVYRDAQENSSQSAGMWAAIVFFAGPLIGLVLYFIFAREKGAGRHGTHY